MVKKTLCLQIAATAQSRPMYESRPGYLKRSNGLRPPPLVVPTQNFSVNICLYFSVLCEVGCNFVVNAFTIQVDAQPSCSSGDHLLLLTTAAPINNLIVSSTDTLILLIALSS